MSSLCGDPNGQPHHVKPLAKDTKPRIPIIQTLRTVTCRRLVYFSGRPTTLLGRRAMCAEFN